MTFSQNVVEGVILSTFLDIQALARESDALRLQQRFFVVLPRALPVLRDLLQRDQLILSLIFENIVDHGTKSLVALRFLFEKNVRMIMTTKRFSSVYFFVVSSVIVF